MSESRITLQFHNLAKRGLVRLREEPDDMPASEVIGDLFADSNGCSGGSRHFTAENKRLNERISDEGITGVFAEFWTGKAWHEVSAVWGFIGQDWQGSGYDTDLMAQAMRELADFWKSDQGGEH